MSTKLFQIFNLYANIIFDVILRMMDARAGYCREINLEPFGLSSECTQIRANSKYLVVVNGQAEWTKVGIFDLCTAGENTGEGCNTPLCCFNVSVIYFLVCIAISSQFTFLYFSFTTKITRFQ